MGLVRNLVLSMASLALLAGCPSPMTVDAGDVVSPMDAAMDTGSLPDVRPDVRRDVAQSGCRALADCESCTAMDGCGWSAAEMSCLDGTVDGSADGSSTGSDWSWLTGMCPGSTLCQSATACDECTGNAGCGWCFGTNHCLPGLAAGSTDGTCSGTGWSTAVQACPSSVAFCATRSDTCNDCTMSDFCGFCPGTGECLPGTADGPVMGTTQNTCPGWSWQTTDCAPFDAGTPDAAPSDATSPDAGPADGGVIDAGPADADTDVTSPG